MSFTVEGQPASGGQEWARHLMFGPDHQSHTPDSAFRRLVVGHAESGATELGDAAQALDERALDAGEHAAAIKIAADELRERATVLTVGVRESPSIPAGRPFRVVLMGRTMAGKSTLFEYLSGGDGARVGDGRQRFSRDACARVSDTLGFEVVDTPGVGAMDGEKDFRTAFAQVPDAELILWVSSDQATQEQTGRALEQLGVLGKPIVVALNCLADLDDPINLMDLMEQPERIFGGDALDNLRPIARHLGRAGSRIICAIPVHAQAALRAASNSFGADDGDTVMTNSRIEVLLDVLRRERDRTATQRRVISLSDRSRTELLSAAGGVRQLWVGLRAAADASRGSRCDLERRAGRHIDDAGERLSAGITEILARRERWVERVDVDDDINKLWTAEAAELQTELEEFGGAVDADLRAAMEALSADLAEDWATFAAGNFEGLTGYGEAWINRAAKVGGRVAGGAAIGFAVGSVVPGLGNAVGAGVGAALGLVSIPVFKLFDTVVDLIFRSKADVRKRRRDQVREQILPIIEAIRVELTARVENLIAGWQRALNAELAAREQHTRAMNAAASQASAVQEALEVDLRNLDTDTARELLRRCGYDRAADAVLRATRSQGVGVAIDLPARQFSEVVLFPLMEAVEPLVPVSPSARFPSSSALQVLVGLTAGTLTVTRMTATHLDAYVDEAVPEGVRDAWASLAHVHTGVAVALAHGGDE